MGFWKIIFLTGEKGLFEKNRDSVNEYLSAVVQVVTIIMIALMGIMTFVSIRWNYSVMFKTVYSSF